MKLTKQQISELTDTQLNRAVIWCYPPNLSRYELLSGIQDDGEIILMGSYEDTVYYDYLEDWNLLMTLVVENEIEHGHIIGSQGAHYAIYLTPYIESKVLEVSRGKSLQRAYAEALVYLKVGV